MPCENRTASGNVHCTSPPRTVGGGPAASAEAGANVQFRRVLLGPARAREAAGVTVASCVARRLVGATPAAAAPAEAPAEAASVICRGRRLLPSGSPFPVSDPGPAVSRRHRRASLPPARPPAGGCGTKAAARALGFDGERFGRRCDSLPPSDLGGDWGARRAVCRWACTYSRRKKEAAGVQRVYCESFLASLALLRKDLCIFIEYSRRMRILVIMDYAAHAKRRKKSASSS